MTADQSVNWWFDFGIDPTDPADWPLMSLISGELL